MEKTAGTTFEYDVFLSYQHGQKEVVQALYEKMKACGFKVWIDTQCMQGNLSDAMAEGINGSRTFVLCMSHGYEKSKDCKREAEFAIRVKNKPVVLLKLQQDYRPDGWLGLLVGSALYTKVLSTRDVEAQWERIHAELASHGPTVLTGTSGEAHGQRTKMDSSRGVERAGATTPDPITATEGKHGVERAAATTPDPITATKGKRGVERAAATTPDPITATKEKRGVERAAATTPDPITATKGKHGGAEVSLFGIADDNVDELRRRLAAGGDPRERNASNFSPLMTYCLGLGDTPPPLRLVKHLAPLSDLNSRGGRGGSTALHKIVHAVKEEGSYTRKLEAAAIEAAECLITAGADATVSNVKGSPVAVAEFWAAQRSGESRRLLERLAVVFARAEGKRQ